MIICALVKDELMHISAPVLFNSMSHTVHLASYCLRKKHYENRKDPKDIDIQI